MTTAPTENKTALITGGAIRVGRAIALTLARDAHMDIAITYRHSEADALSLQRDIKSMGRRCQIIHADFEKSDAPNQVADALLEHFGRVDALINNASVFEPTDPNLGITSESFNQHMIVNARAPLMLIQRLAPHLGEHYREDDPTTMGRVINFIDIHVMGEPLPGYVAYNASKAALQEITMTMAMQLAPRITVNALAPGVVAWADSYTDEMKQKYMTRVPLARPGTPEDAAAAALFLVRDAHYQTAQIIRLDGGRLLT